MKADTMIRLKIKEVAKEKKVSQRQLIIRSGLDQRVVVRVMHNDLENIELRTLDKLAKVLGVDASTLIESVPDNEE